MFRSRVRMFGRWIRVALLTSILLLPAAGLSAQGLSADSAGFHAWPLGEIGWQVTEVAGHGASLLGGTLGFGVTRRTVIGGSAFQLHGSAAPDSPVERDPRRLDFGYGGIAVSHLRPLHTDWAASASVLLGAGHATVRHRTVDVELGADNFGVVEIQLNGVWLGPSPLRVSLGGGYRAVSGVQDLPGVSAADLRGFALTLRLGLAGL